MADHQESLSECSSALKICIYSFWCNVCDIYVYALIVCWNYVCSYAKFVDCQEDEQVLCQQ